MTDIGNVRENIRARIESKGYDLDSVELVEMRGEYNPDLLGSYCEGLFRTADGEYFKCGEGTTSSPYQQRAGLLVTAGTKLIAVTPEQAQEWLDNPVSYPGMDA